MGYAAARGGAEAIVAAERLVRQVREEGSSPQLGVDQVEERMTLAVDRVMGEAGLWAPELAARALRQAQGDLVEASHLLRAYRSTRPRLARAVTVSSDELEILRRIVPAYRVPSGPQLLGRTLDYVGRLLEVPEPRPATDGATRAAAAEGATAATAAAIATGDASVPDRGAPATPVTQGEPEPPPGQNGSLSLPDRRPRRLLDLLRGQGLAVDRRRCDDPEPYDVLRQPVRPGVPRSARLSTMARAETGALVNLWYRNVLGPDGYIHEITLGEVRHGRLPVRVEHPVTGRPVVIGAVRVTEVEAIESLDGPDEPTDLFDVGYGLCLGHNERKAIAMANLDIALERDQGRSLLEQSVLMTTDGLESSGFLEHLKLPHYVTFRSMIERKLAARQAAAAERDRPDLHETPLDGSRPSEARQEDDEAVPPVAAGAPA